MAIALCRRQQQAIKGSGTKPGKRVGLSPDEEGQYEKQYAERVDEDEGQREQAPGHGGAGAGLAVVRLEPVHLRGPWATPATVVSGCNTPMARASCGIIPRIVCNSVPLSYSVADICTAVTVYIPFFALFASRR